MTAVTTVQLLTRTDVVLRPDPDRVVARLFVPGNELLTAHESRAGPVVARVLALPEPQVVDLVADVHARWGGRHRDLPGVLRASFAQVAHRVPTDISEARRTLLGAYFTQEQAIEAAALFNPSVVAHPDQSGLPPGHVRFVMSLRAVGEGHLSCIEWRSGSLGPAGELTLDPPGAHAEVGTATLGRYEHGRFASWLEHAGADGEAASFLMAQLPGTFDLPDLDRALASLSYSGHGRVGDTRTDELARRLAHCAYDVEFPEATTLSERVLRPFGPTESQGMEDARLVRVVADDGAVSYRGTYTAFDGRHIAPQLLETDDFRRFRVSLLTGPAAVDKGMAIFPRTVAGRHLALTRSDRETTGVTSSADGYWWGPPSPLVGPGRAWDLVQTGNCGSPVETDAGWLVLTHGVGPMREYAIGAILLDLDDPTRVVGMLEEPLLRPDEVERHGYVPNVVYSCGSMRHGDTLLLPYGCSDSSVRFALVDLPLLLARITATGPR